MTISPPDNPYKEINTAAFTGLPTNTTSFLYKVRTAITTLNTKDTVHNNL
jgi:hypothetical protein